MSYVYRINCRVKDEGVSGTLKYCILVCYHSLYSLLRDTFLDLKYSGKILKGNHKTSYKHLGANDVYHTDYSVMPLIFNHISISRDDVLVDVGCGKGRVINYWLSQKLSNKMIGLELDPLVGRQTSSQFTARKNVKIIIGDAIANLPDDGTVFYFYNPFEAQNVARFEKRIADMSQKKSVKIIYYNPKSLYIFNNGRWDINFISFEKDLGIRRWGRLNKYHDLAIITRRSNTQ
ncbi:MAG: hypothetical protein N3B21_10520 [Clostridia bacterium]|nr:hypothetical protein [Clostridia bacterium]